VFVFHSTNVPYFYSFQTFSYSVALLLTRDDHGNRIPIPIGNPMGMGIDDTIGNGNGKVWELPCMGMALILMGLNSHRRMQCLAYVA